MCAAAEEKSDGQRAGRAKSPDLTVTGVDEPEPALAQGHGAAARMKWTVDRGRDAGPSAG